MGAQSKPVGGRGGGGGGGGARTCFHLVTSDSHLVTRNFHCAQHVLSSSFLQQSSTYRPFRSTRDCKSFTTKLNVTGSLPKRYNERKTLDVKVISTMLTSNQCMRFTNMTKSCPRLW